MVSSLFNVSWMDTRGSELLYLFIYLFCSTGVWAQGLHLEPLHQPFFMMGIFEIGSRTLFPRAGLEPQSSWTLPSEYLGLQMWATGAQLQLYFNLCFPGYWQWGASLYFLFCQWLFIPFERFSSCIMNEVELDLGRILTCLLLYVMQICFPRLSFVFQSITVPFSI
jgi:hypothetical protein